MRKHVSPFRRFRGFSAVTKSAPSGDIFPRQRLSTDLDLSYTFCTMLDMDDNQYKRLEDNLKKHITASIDAWVVPLIHMIETQTQEIKIMADEVAGRK